ncbi:MAG: branched-chain-amino-acid transaminase [Endomicrobia bacterium]|nr:branched-chain-amino-acid transaminase [Endomicrobiia bacterium]MCX7940297.1 branched-chain-amino-acid transaminase [Endomicrobiia bacterium]MDW8055799.1 branched-chain-amino-acid transaminase [Elusimicrobiota bacterium]
MKVYIDGKFYDKEEAKISVFDHGLLYGDGVFEGIRSYNRRVFKLAEHIDRLYNSAKAIMLEIPVSKREIEQAVLETLRINNLADAYIRLVVTRGVGDLGLDPRKCKNPSIIIITDKIVLYPQEFYEKGLEVITVSTRRNLPSAINPAIKSLNYLNNIFAKIEAIKAGCEEAIMLNDDGYVAECTGDNIFIIKNNVLITPPIYIGALPGITRDTVIEIAKTKLKLMVKEEPFTIYHVYTADECFLTGTAAEVIPVVKVDSRIINDGKPGELTKQIMKEFKELTRTTGVQY